MARLSEDDIAALNAAQARKDAALVVQHKREYEKLAAEYRLALLTVERLTKQLNDRPDVWLKKAVTLSKPVVDAMWTVVASLADENGVLVPQDVPIRVGVEPYTVSTLGAADEAFHFADTRTPADADADTDALRDDYGVGGGPNTAEDVRVTVLCDELDRLRAARGSK